MRQMVLRETGGGHQNTKEGKESCRLTSRNLGERKDGQQIKKGLTGIQEHIDRGRKKIQEVLKKRVQQR